MPFGDAALHRRSGTVHFGSFVHPLLAKHGQQHDPTVTWVEERDPVRNPLHVEAEFEEPVAQCARMRHSQQSATFDLPIDVEGDRTEGIHRQ
jgi:hypothetical protein